MKKSLKFIIALVAMLVLISLIYFNGNSDRSNSGDMLGSQPDTSQRVQVRYFSSVSDKVVIEAGTQTLYSNNPTTSLSYYAVDNSNELVHFRNGDRAFVRIMGVSRFFGNNSEIFHPSLNDGSKNDTIFSGNISIPSEPGVYLVKVCLGPRINLDTEGTMIWPFGCFEDSTSVEMIVYDKGVNK